MQPSTATGRNLRLALTPLALLVTFATVVVALRVVTFVRSCSVGALLRTNSRWMLAVEFVRRNAATFISWPSINFMLASRRVMILAFLGSLVLFGCSGLENDTVKEAVLSPGQSVEATNKYGTVRVSYVSPITRKYEWDGESRVVQMTARKEPFLGKLGIYDPANSWGFSSKSRLVVQESALHFDNEEDMTAALIRRQRSHGLGVYKRRLSYWLWQDTNTETNQR